MREILFPFVSAFITGGLGGLVVGVWAWAVGAPDALKVGGVFGAVVAFIAWLVLRAKVEYVENSLRGYREDPAPEVIHAETVRVELRQDEGRRMDYIDLPATRAQLHQLARGLQEGIPFTVSAWTGSRKPFSRGEFEALRAEFIRRGLAEWRNQRSPAQGAELTPTGRAVVRYLATPTPER